MNDEHESSALPSYMYGDPALAYERAESMTCKGCKHLWHLIGGSLCAKNIKTHPNRCAKHYKEEA